MTDKNEPQRERTENATHFDVLEQAEKIVADRALALGISRKPAWNFDDIF